MRRFLAFALSSTLVALVACSSDSSSSPSGTADTASITQSVAKQYATNVRAAYGASLDTVKALQTAIDALVASPSADKLEAAKQAWLAAREPYGRTEAFRFYGGPIDNEENGPEGRINGWPLDENFIDYTKDDADAGIINHPETFATVDIALVRDQNEQGGEKNLSAGFHAIEFLLWGQDLSETGPGNRPFTDYVVGTGTAKNQERRGAYLKAAAALLVEDIQSVYDAWDDTKADSYAKTFTALSERDVLERLIKSVAALPGFELSSERLNNAYSSQDQEEEHSCFSDNTKADVVANLKGVEDVWLGRWGSNDGPGLEDVVKAKNPELHAKAAAAVTKAIGAAEAIPQPFDRAIFDDAPNGGRQKIKDAIDATKALGDVMLEVGLLYDLRISLE